jgi:hypothetical protein
MLLAALTQSQHSCPRSGHLCTTTGRNAKISHRLSYVRLALRVRHQHFSYFFGYYPFKRWIHIAQNKIVFLIQSICNHYIIKA